MSKVMVTESYLDDIADAIREKTGTQDTYTPAEMADAIESISGGGITPTGTINITENGTVDVTQYASAEVDVPQGITPTGTLSITQNGTVDVTNYASASVAVPNPSTGTKQISITQNGTTTENVTDYASAEIAVAVSPNVGTKSITQNGTYNASSDNLDGYSSVTVSVDGYNANDFLDKTKPTGAVSSDAITIDTSLANRTGITAISLPNATSIPGNMCDGCTNLASASMPAITTFYNRNYAFRNCAALTSVYLPLATIIGNNQFRGCTSLVRIALPKATTIYDEAFKSCSNLEVADFGNADTNFFRGTIFDADTKLTTLILRKTSGVVPLSNVNVFNNTPFASGKAGGTIYIPKVLYDALGTGTNDYKAASNWSTIDGYGTVTWAKIEGSQYENYYADGTPVT